MNILCNIFRPAPILNMKIKFITYGDLNYKDSLQRIQKEAESIGIFNEIHIYTPEKLPSPFQEYTTQYKRGGGYWLWKPWVIQDALNKADKDDIIIYADAGCTLLKHKDWFRYFDILKYKEGIFFVTSGRNKKWCKREVFSFFQTKNNLWKFANQIQATFIIIKKTSNNDIIRQWCHLAELHPHLFIDVNSKEIYKEEKGFKEHRHDQSVLTACICTSKHLSHYCLLPVKMEKRYIHGQAVLASRISSTSIRGANISTPAKTKAATFFDNIFVNPFRIFSTRLLFKLSKL